MTMPRLGTALAAVWLAAAAGARADAPDADALSLADRPPVAPERARDWRLAIEMAAAHGDWRDGPTRVDSARLSIDGNLDTRVLPELRAVLSDRLDLVRSDATPRVSNVNTLREAYLSWQRSPQDIVDVGRINLRYGVALGYNPSDFFKADALRSIVSPDPAVLRENRQGTFALEAQRLWASSSMTAVFSPRLASAPNSGAASLDVGATNPRTRWLLAGSRRFGESFNPQVLVFGGDDMPPQFGLNLSGLLDDATVAFGEFSCGRGRSLTARALALAQAERGQCRGAFGSTTTTPFNLSITAEAEFNSAAPDRPQWGALRATSPADPLRILGMAQALQDLPVRDALFFYASWQDLLVKHLDLSAFARVDLVTHSRAQWLELRRHWDRVDVALQWQLDSGAAGSVYGTMPQARSVEAVLRVFL